MSLIREIHPERQGPGGDDRSSDGAEGGPRLSTMDVPRPPSPPFRRIAWIALGIATLAGGGLYIGSLEPAGTVVDRDLLVFGTVARGPMVRQVHGWGSFVPDRTQLVRGQQPGVVEAVYVIEGQAVQSGDRIIEISNSEVELAVEKAEQKFAAARAGMIALSREQSARRLSLESSVAETRLEYLHAEDEFEELRARPPGQVREIAIRRAQERVDAIARRLEADEERLALISSSTEQQLGARREELRWVESILDSERARLSELTLRAGGDGTVERVLIQPGTRVAGGDALAEITLSDRLKAEIQIYSSEGGEVAVGQAVSLEAAGGRVTGSVDAIEPMSGGKLIRVTVALDENPPMPPGSNPDVEARIHLGTLDDVLFVERPAYAAAEGFTSVFRLAPDSSSAERVKVRLGRGSVDRIEVLSGLEPGDRIIVSDVSGYDDIDVLELE